jgi:hypothetical protein
MSRLEDQEYERKHSEILIEFDRRLRDIESEEIKRINKELDAFQKELSLMLEREKIVFFS